MSQIQRLLLLFYLAIFSFFGLFILLAGKIFSLGSNTLIITEVMPDPKGSDRIYEWIELKNPASEAINLKEWQLNNVVLPDINIRSGETIILVNDVNAVKTLYGIQNNIVKTKVSLNNAGATLELKKGDEISKFVYPKAKENISFELLDGECATIRLNPNGNSIGTANYTCDQLNIGTNEQVTGTPTSSDNKLIISKVCPSPKGGFEFLEIQNISANKFNINNWTISDTKGVDILPNIDISPQKTFTFYPQKISLNNDGDQITITNPIKTYSDTLSYPKSKENECFTPGSLKASKLPSVTIKADSSKSGPLISIQKNTSVNTSGKTGFKIELKIPRLFRIQFRF